MTEGQRRIDRAAMAGTTLARTLRHHVAIDIEPPPTLANETTTLMLAYGGSIADARTGDELHFGRVFACHTRIDNPKSQPFLLPVEWNRTGSGTRMPCREQILLIAQDKGAVAGSHQRLRIGRGAASVPGTTALGIRPGGVARARILGRRIQGINLRNDAVERSSRCRNAGAIFSI